MYVIHGSGLKSVDVSKLFKAKNKIIINIIYEFLKKKTSKRDVRILYYFAQNTVVFKIFTCEVICLY